MVNVGGVLFEAKAADGKEPKNVANSALYETYKVTEGINSIALLQRAFEIEPEKLVTPFPKRTRLTSLTSSLTSKRKDTL